MMTLETRRSVVMKSAALSLAPATLYAPTAFALESPLLGTEALQALDHSLFPNRRGALLGAVFGGLVLFAITRNPMGLLIGVAGGAVVGGAVPAATGYVAARKAEVGEAGVQNATLGDQRADNHNLEPYAAQIIENHDQVAEPMDKILDALQRHEVTRQPGPVEGEERDALEAMAKTVAQHSAKLGFLAGCAAKHRDVGTVYGHAATITGLTGDPRFARYDEASKDRTAKLTSRLTATGQKVDQSTLALSRLLALAQ